METTEIYRSIINFSSFFIVKGWFHDSILNALVHRDYSVHTDRSTIRLVMYEDRLELENPGGLYGRITVDDLGKASADTRNPYIAGALQIMIDTENRFLGIPTIITELKKADMPAPVFSDKRGVFNALLHVLEKNLQRDLDLEHQLILLRPILVHC